MIKEEAIEEEFSCTPPFTISSHDSADVGEAATGKEMVSEKSGTTEYMTMWELSKSQDQDKEEFYVPALSQFIARPSPPVCHKFVHDVSIKFYCFFVRLSCQV